MNPLALLAAQLPEWSRERLESLRAETLGRSVGGGLPGPVETALAFEVVGMVEEELRRRSEGTIGRVVESIQA